MASGVNVWVTVPSRRSDAKLTTKDAFDESGTFYINEKMSMHVVCLAKNSQTKSSSIDRCSKVMV